MVQGGISLPAHISGQPWHKGGPFSAKRHNLCLAQWLPHGSLQAVAQGAGHGVAVPARLPEVLYHFCLAGLLLQLGCPEQPKGWRGPGGLSGASSAQGWWL